MFIRTFKRLSLRGKFIFGIVGIILSLGIVTGVFIQYIQEKTLTNELQEKGISITKNLAARSVDPILTENPVALQRLVSEVKALEKDVFNVYVLDHASKIIVHTFEGGFPSDLLLANVVEPSQKYSIQLLETEEGYISDIGVPILEGKAGTAHILMSQKRIMSTIADTRQTIMGITFVAIILGASLGYYFGGLITKPISTLSQGVRAVSKGDLDYVIRVDTPVEVGELAAAFNQMTKELKRSRDELRGYSEQLEQKVEEKTRELKSILDATSDGIVLLDRDHNILYNNKALEKQSKWLKTEDVVIAFCEKTSNMFKDGMPRSLEISLSNPENKGEVFLYVRGMPIKDERGEVIACVESMTDITNVKRMEQRLKEYSEELEKKIEERSKELIESEKKYRNLIETMNEGLVVIDAGGSINFSNKRFAEMVGYALEELAGKDFSSLFRGENREKLVRRLAKKADGLNFETEFITKKGDPLPVLMSTTSLSDENNRRRGNFIVISDITEIKKLEKKLLQSEKLAATGKLAASIAHEINNPLFGIKNCIYLLMDHMRSEDAGRKYLEMADRELDRIAKIVKQLLEFHRPSIDTLAPTDVNRVMEDVLALVGNQLVTNRIKVSKNLLPNLPEINASAEHLRQVFLNIILNAQEAMLGGGRLSITTEAAENSVSIKFADTGLGIPEDYIEHIFDPFYTTKKGKTGLGLSVSHGIIKRHNGRIEVKSKVGEGSTFTVILPVKRGGRFE